MAHVAPLHTILRRWKYKSLLGDGHGVSHLAQSINQSIEWFTFSRCIEQQSWQGRVPRHPRRPRGRSWGGRETGPQSRKNGGDRTVRFPKYCEIQRRDWQYSYHATTHLIVRCHKVHHASFSSASIATKDRHELMASCTTGWTIAFSNQCSRPLSSLSWRRKSFPTNTKLFFTETTAAFPHTNSHHW